MKKTKRNPIPAAKAAIVALTEIKATTEAFDRGESNVFDTLDAIIVAVEAYRTVEQLRHEAA